MKFLIFRQSSLGDVILISPVIHRLREAFPDSTIDVLTKKQYATLFYWDSRVNKVHTFNGNSDFFSIAWSLRTAEYNFLIDLQANIRSFLLRMILFPAVIRRYDKRRLARNAVVRHPEKKLSVNHSIEAYLGTLKPFGISQSLIPPEIRIDLENAGDVVQSLAELKSEIQIIAICPGAKHFEKRWPKEMFAEVARALHAKSRFKIIIISSTNDNLDPRLGIDDQTIQIARDWEIRHLAELLSMCSLSLTNDSGLMHLSESVGTPVLAIFGPTNPRLGFAPTLPQSRIFCDDVPCSPCSVHGQKRCWQPEKYCFKNITSDRVLVEIKSMLDK